MSSKEENPPTSKVKEDNLPTSKEDAAAKCVRPPPEKYDPDKRSRWSITMTVAWIIWNDLDAVRNEFDDYREKCADWKLDPVATARAKLLVPELREDLQKESPWRLHQWELSGWNRLRLRAISENLPPQDAAEEGRIKATALEYENVKAYVGNPIEIPAHYWPYLKRTDDPLTGKAMLSGPDGRVYREVQFSRLDAKKLWPKSQSLSGEPLVESGAVEVLPEPLEPERVGTPEPTRQAEPELLKPAAWFDDVRKDNPQRKNELSGAYAGRLHPLMQEAHEAKHVAKLWPLKTLLRRLYDK